MRALRSRRAGHRLYVADTNNHCLRVIDTATRQVTTLTLTGLTAPPAAAVTVGAGARLLRLDLPLPAGLHLNPEAPLRVKLHSDAGLVADQTVTLAPGRPREVKVTFRVGHGTLRVAVDAILCDDAGTTCRPSAATAEVALTVAATGADASPELVVRLPLR